MKSLLRIVLFVMAGITLLTPIFYRPGGRRMSHQKFSAPRTRKFRWDESIPNEVYHASAVRRRFLSQRQQLSIGYRTAVHWLFVMSTEPRSRSMHYEKAAS
jgi:hypothetical protein